MSKPIYKSGFDVPLKEIDWAELPGFPSVDFYILIILASDEYTCLKVFPHEIQATKEFIDQCDLFVLDTLYKGHKDPGDGRSELHLEESLNFFEFENMLNQAIQDQKVN